MQQKRHSTAKCSCFQRSCRLESSLLTSDFQNDRRVYLLKRESMTCMYYSCILLELVLLEQDCAYCFGSSSCIFSSCPCLTVDSRFMKLTRLSLSKTSSITMNQWEVRLHLPPVSVQIYALCSRLHGIDYRLHFEVMYKKGIQKHPILRQCLLFVASPFVFEINSC